jgi:hypothetical protein
MPEHNIRVDTGRLDITVNDEGEQISCFPEDAGFMERFHGLITSAQLKQKEYARLEKKQAAKAAKTDEAYLTAQEEMLGLYRDTCTHCAEEIDSIFGSGSNQKIFGDCASLISYIDFLEQFSNVVKDFQSERNKKFEKYMKK